MLVSVNGRVEAGSIPAAELDVLRLSRYYFNTSLARIARA
jgi:hypothetical protein